MIRKLCISIFHAILVLSTKLKGAIQTAWRRISASIDVKSIQRLFRLAVRMSPLHGEDTGSIPVKDNKVFYRTRTLVLDKGTIFYKSMLNFIKTLPHYWNILLLRGRNIWQLFLFCNLWWIPHYGLRSYIFAYFLNKLFYLFNKFLTEFVLLLSTEWLLAYRYLLTVLFFLTLLRKFVKVYYRTLRRPVFDCYIWVRNLRYRWLGWVLNTIAFSVGFLVQGYGKFHVYYLCKTLSKYWYAFVSYWIGGLIRFITLILQIRHHVFVVSIIFYFTFSWYLHFLLTLTYQMRACRVLYTRLAKKTGWQWPTCYTFDEIFFCLSGLKRFLFGVFTIRLHDMNIPTMVDMGYPVTWMPQDELVQGVFDSSSYFFWATHSNLDKTLLPRLQKYHLVPQDFITEKSANLSVHAQTVLHWAQNADISREHKLVLDDLLNELYFAFHDHFRVTILAEIENDPFYLLRLLSSPKLQQFITLQETGNYTFDVPIADYIWPRFQDYCIDMHILERVFEHWSFIKVSSENTAKLVSPFVAEIQTLSSQVETPVIFDSTTTQSWSNWEFVRTRNPKYTIKQWYDENWGYYFQQYIDSVCFYFINRTGANYGSAFAPSHLLLGNISYNRAPYYDDFGWIFPIYSLQGLPWQDTWLFPCLIIYMWAMAMFLHNCTHPLFYDWLVYEFRFIDFNVQFEWLFGIDVTNTEFKEIVYWIAAFTCIPFYYIPNFKPYYRRRLLTYSEIEYTRYIRQAAYYDQAVDPYLTQEADYFHWYLSENLTPLAAMRDKQKMVSFHNRRYRARLTFRQGLPYNMAMTPYLSKFYRRRMRRYLKNTMANGLTFLEQDWLFSFFQCEARLQRFQISPPPGPSNELRTHRDFLREYHFYTESTLLKWYTHKKSDKHTNFHRGVVSKWFGGFWRANEVLNVGKKVGITPETRVRKYDRYKKMVESTIHTMYTRSNAYQNARMIRRLREKEITFKDIPNEIVFQFEHGDIKYCLPLTYTTIKLEEQQASETLFELFRAKVDTPADVYNFDKLAIEIRDGIFKTQFHKDRHAFLPVYRFFHFMKCLPPVLDLGPVEYSLCDVPSLKGTLTDNLVALLDYWSYICVLWNGFRKQKRAIGASFGHVPNVLAPVDHFAMDPYYEAEIRFWTDYSEKYRYREKKVVDRAFSIVKEYNKVLTGLQQVKDRLNTKTYPVWKWKHDVNFLTFFTEQVICPPFGTEDINDGFDLHFPKAQQTPRKLLPWGRYLENNLKQGSHRYILSDMLHLNKPQVIVGQSPTKVLEIASDNTLWFRPKSIWHLIYFRLVYTPVKLRWIRFWRRVRYWKDQLNTLGGLIKVRKRKPIDTVILSTSTSEQLGRRSVVNALHNHSKKRKYRKSYVVFEPGEWHAVYDKYTRAMYQKFGTMVPTTFHIYPDEYQLPNIRAYDLDMTFRRDIHLAKTPSRPRTFFKLSALNRVPLSYAFRQLTHEDYMTNLMRAKIRYGSVPAHAFDGTVMQYREALEEEYQFNNRLFKKSKFVGRFKRGRIGSLDARASHYNLYQKYQSATRISQSDFRRGKIHKPGTPEVSQFWYYYDRYSALKNAVRDRYLVFWPLERELVSCWVRPIQYVTTPTSIASDLADTRRRTSIKGRILAQATASSLRKYNKAPLQVPTQRAVDLMQADVEQMYPMTLQQHRYTRGLFMQQAIANVYWRMFRTWAPIRPKHVKVPNKWKYSFREWLRIDPSIVSYFNEHHDRLRFLKEKKLSFGASIYERLIQTKTTGWSHTHFLYGRGAVRLQRRAKRTKRLHERLEILNQKVKQWYGVSILNQPFWRYHYQWRNKIATFKHVTPYQNGPWNVHIYDAINHVEDPSERLDITLKLLENHNVDRNHPVIMDYFLNDLAASLRFPEDIEPVLGDFENAKEMSLPGTIISPSELRVFWRATVAFTDYKRRLQEFFKYVTTFCAVKDRQIRERFYPRPFGVRNFYWRRYNSPKASLLNRSFMLDQPETDPELEQWGWSKRQWTWDMFMLTETENLAVDRFVKKLDADWTAYREGRATKELHEENVRLAGKMSKKLLKAKEEDKKRKADKKKSKYLTLLNDDVLATDLELFPLHMPSWDERIALPIGQNSQKLVRVPVTGDDLRDKGQTNFVTHPTGYIRTTGVSDEDLFGWKEYLLLTRKQLRADRVSRNHPAHTVNPFYKRKVWKISQHLDYRTNVEWQQNPLIFADTPNSFAEYTSKEFLHEWELKRIDRHLRQQAALKIEPAVSTITARDPKTRKRFYDKHFAYFFDLIRKDWAEICMTPQFANQVMHEFLIPELENLSKKELPFLPTSAFTTPIIKNYRSTYFFDILPDLIEVYEGREERRKEKEEGLVSELAYVKKKYKGRYYTSIREYLVEGLEYQLARVKADQAYNAEHQFWKKKGYLWETKVFADWFIWCDTLGEIELRDPLDYIKNDEHWIIDEKLMNPFYSLPIEDRRANGLNHYIYLSRSYYQDFEITPERFAVNRSHWSDDIDTHKYSYDRFWQRKSPLQKHINSMLLTKTQNVETEIGDYSRLIDDRQTHRGLYYENLGDNTLFTIGVQDRVSFQGQSWWVISGEGTERDWTTAINEFENPPIQVQFFTPPTYFYPWFRFPQKLSHIRDECIIAGLYNITQATMTPVQFFTQAMVGGNGGAIDLFGVYCDRGMALAPYEWFDFYDPITNRVVNTAPNLNYIFKEGKQFRRYFGYFTPTTTWDRFVGKWSVVDKIESIASGYTELQSIVGIEYAVSYTFNKYIGGIPAYVFDFLLYTSYWGYAWISAIYHGSCIDSHIDKIKLMTPQDGLLELGLTGKEYERSLRAFQLKVLHSPEIDFDKILLKEIEKRDLRVCNEYCYMSQEHIPSIFEELRKKFIEEPIKDLREFVAELDRLKKLQKG